MARTRLTPGAYLGLPQDERFSDIGKASRSLNSLYWELPNASPGKLVVITPYMDAKGLEFLLSQWTSAHPVLQIEIVHRKETSDDAERNAICSVMRKYATSGRVRFLTFPRRDPSTHRLADRTSFHCKLIDPGNGQIVELSSNLTSYAQAQNIEVAYVHPAGKAQDLLALARRIRQLAVADPWQEAE